MRIAVPFQRKRARIEIIPLIDIIFFLLATFVMVSLSMVKNQGIPVTLPAASTGQPLDRSVLKTVTITKNGEIFLDKESLDLAELSRRLAALKAGQDEVKVLVNGDNEADFGQVIAVLDEIRKLGISKVSIQTKGAQAKT
jgi:biopolymer transport protein ExbD